MQTRTETEPWPTGPAGNILVGNLPEIWHNWLDALTRYARDYGDFVPIRLGPLQAVLLSDPAYIEDVLVTHNRAFTKSCALRNSRRIFGDGLVTNEGQPWLAQRRRVQPTMHRQYVAAYARTMVECTRQMLAGWSPGDERDLYRDLSQLTLSIVTRTLFGAGITELEAATISHSVEVLLAGFERRINSLLFLLPDTLPLPGHLGYLRAAQRLDDVVYRIIERARHHQPDGHTLLTALLDAQASPAGQLTDRQLRDELVSLIVAGYETTAVTLTWAFALLGQYPDVESRLVAELDRHLDHDAVSVDAVPRLEYVDWVIAESLRLYPTSWVIARETQTACSVGPFRITPGTVVLMSQWTVHRDSRFFDDPDVFRPERWANHLMDRLPRFAYFPFGGGPRVCVGNDFARLEMVLLLATIARQFRLEFRPDAPLTPRPSATLRPDPHPRVVVRPRGTAGRVTRHHSRYHEALDGHPQTGAGGRAAPWAVCQR